MKKNSKSSVKKEMSEGKAIAIAVLLFAGGLVGLIYALQFLFGYFFPNF